MIGFVSKIKLDIIRIPLLILVFPLVIIHYIGCALLPVCIGGHPNKHRLIELDFYSLPVALFWLSWDGYFVEDGA